MVHKIKLLSLGLLLIISAKGQDVKKVTVDDKLYGNKEIFYVLKANQEIRHGEYKRTLGKLKTVGQYTNNKRTGIWQSYGNSGELIQTIDFATNTVTPNKMPDNSKYWAKEGDIFNEVKPDQAPQFIGGYSALYYFIARTLRYPSDARRYNVQGQVIISVLITKDGQIINETVESNLGYGLDEEALRVIQQIPDEWVSGKVNNQSSDMKILIPIQFRLG